MEAAAEAMAILPFRRSPEDIRFTVWPLWHEGLSAWLAFAATLGVAAAVAHSSQEWRAGALVFSALQLAGWRLWLPVFIVLDARGITQQLGSGEQSLAWQRVKRAEIAANTLVVIAGPELAFGQAPAQITLPLGEYRHQVLAALAYHAPQTLAGGEGSDRGFRDSNS